VMQPGKTASISLWHPDTNYLKSLMPGLRSTFAAKGWPFRVTSTVAWINLELDHVSKGTGVARLMKMCGLRKERVAGIGDTMGDMAIREHVGHFACPANAEEGLKQAADYVSPHTEVDGVLDILARLLG